MNIAVITPYFKEPLETLERCHQSVLAQEGVTVRHFMVSDGFPRGEVDRWDCDHLKLPHSGLYGNVSRVFGVGAAFAQGFDAYAFLDADNFFDPDHLALMQAVMNKGCSVVTSPRNLYRSDTGEFLSVDPGDSDGGRFNDANCYLFSRDLLCLIDVWLFTPAKLAYLADRFFWAAIKGSGVSVGRSEKPTLNYTTSHACHYLAQGITPPAGSKKIVWSGHPLDECRVVAWGSVD